MKSKKTVFLAIVVCIATTSGCASYRTNSNISSGSTSAVSPDTQIIITQESLQGRNYEEIGIIEVSVKKLTAFHKDPTTDQADEVLAEKARAIGADAVINVTYERGIGLTTWGYMDARGMGVKFTE